MKYGIIVEDWTDFEIGKYYCVVKEKEKIDSFICNDIDRAVIQLNTYQNRGCEIWKYLTESEAISKIDELHDKESVHYELFARSKRLASSELSKMCEVSLIKNRIRKIFLEKRKMK